MGPQDRTEQAVRSMLRTIEAPLYDVGVLSRLYIQAPRNNDGGSILDGKGSGAVNSFVLLFVTFPTYLAAGLQVDGVCMREGARNTILV